MKFSFSITIDEVASVNVFSLMYILQSIINTPCATLIIFFTSSYFCILVVIRVKKILRYLNTMKFDLKYFILRFETEDLFDSNSFTIVFHPRSFIYDLYHLIETIIRLSAIIVSHILILFGSWDEIVWSIRKNWKKRSLHITSFLTIRNIWDYFMKLTDWIFSIS